MASTITSIEYSKESPLNRESPIKKLVSSFITESDATYDRNHGPIPHIAAENHIVNVDGQVTRPLSLSVNDLRSNFPQHEVLCALQCAGNRRHTMRTELKEVEGIDWFDGAVMNCKWKGPRLRDVLVAAGMVQEGAAYDESELFAAFECNQVECQNEKWYGSSVELERCMSESDEVILALEMNSKPLSPNHGFPVRVVIPGVTGARWVKWLDRITIQSQHSQNYYQQYDYKVLPPEVDSSEKAKGYWDQVPPLLDMPINSVVAVPDDNETINLPASGKVEVKGYAVPQGRHGPVTRVQVSGDGGWTWVDARLEGQGGERTDAMNDKWCWKLWKASVAIETGSERTILSRAADAGGNVQQESACWNLRGVAYNGYGMSKGLIVV